MLFLRGPRTGSLRHHEPRAHCPQYPFYCDDALFRRAVDMVEISKSIPAMPSQHWRMILYNFDFSTRYSVESNTAETVGMSKAMCNFQSFMIYFGNLFLVILLTHLCYVLFQVLYNRKKMKDYEKNKTKYEMTSFVLSLTCCLLTLAGEQGRYAAYCSLVYPLSLRLVFYIPLVGGAGFGGALMIPIIRELNSHSRKIGSTTAQPSSQRETASERTKNGSQTRLSSGMKRMVVFTTIYVCAVFFASVRRVVDSITTEHYYETADAGDVGMTEYIAHFTGGVMYIGFGIGNKDLWEFWKGFLTGKPKQDGGGSSRTQSSVNSP